MDLTVDDFLRTYSKFEGLEECVIEESIEFGKCFLDECTWGAKYLQALKLLTAHNLTVNSNSSNGGAGGLVQSDKVGDISRTYKTVNDPTDPDAYYTQSTYGLTFLTLRSTILRTPRVLCR